MRRTAAVLVGASALILASAVAHAGWRIDAEGGAFVPLDDVSFSKNGNSFSVGTVAGGSFAVGGGYGLGDWVDLTAHFQANFSGLEGIGDSLNVYSFTGGGRVYLMPPQRFRPWLVTEIGWYQANASVSPIVVSSISRTDNSFGLNAGAGFDVAINERVSLGADVRYHDAFDAFNGLQFVTTMVNVGIHFPS